MLTRRQDNFIAAYVQTGNANKAYRQTYNARKMSYNAVQVEANRLLERSKVSRRVEELGLGV